MKKTLEKLHKRPKEQRMMIFYAGVAASILAVGYFWVGSLTDLGGGVSLNGQPESIQANSYAQEVNVPTIKKSAFDLWNLSKEMFGEAEKQAKRLYEIGKQLDSDKDQQVAEPAEKDDGEASVKEVFGDQQVDSQQ